MIITSVFYDTDESKNQHHAADKITQSITLKTNRSTNIIHQTLSPIFSLLFFITLKKILKQIKNSWGRTPSLQGAKLAPLCYPEQT